VFYLNKKSFLLIAFILLGSFAMAACTSRAEVKETLQMTQTYSPSPSPLITMAPSPSPSPKSKKVVMENDAFRIYEPAPNDEIGTTFTVKGQARVFEAVLSYSFEDGHKVLAEGNHNAAAGAPEWADIIKALQ
jgi:hypothetical protein